MTDIPDFSIYPNPTNNNFVLSADIAATVTTIEIYSLHGTSMYIKEIQSIGGKINEVISIDALFNKQAVKKKWKYDSETISDKLILPDVLQW